MRLRLLNEEVRGVEPVPHLRVMIDGIVGKLEQAGVDSIIVVRGDGSEANVFGTGDRRNRTVTIRTGQDGNREGDTWQYYRAEIGGTPGFNSQSPEEVVDFVVKQVAGRRQQLWHPADPRNPGKRATDV